MTKSESNGSCFACGRQIKNRHYIVDTRDSQTSFVGPECFKLIVAAGNDGYQPPRGGPRLYRISQQLLESADD